MYIVGYYARVYGGALVHRKRVRPYPRGLQ